MMKVREGSIADKLLRINRWIDNTEAGCTTSAVLVAVIVAAGLAYGILNYPL